MGNAPASVDADVPAYVPSPVAVVSRHADPMAGFDMSQLDSFKVRVLAASHATPRPETKRRGGSLTCARLQNFGGQDGGDDEDGDDDDDSDDDLPELAAA